MNNSNEFRITKSDAIADIATILSCGFEKILEDKDFFILRLPPKWEFVLTQRDEMKYFKDQNGIIRGGVFFNQVYLRCRYSIALVEIDFKKYEPDNAKLLVRDNKTGKVIMDFGSCEAYSDYEKDLAKIAKSAIQLKYPDYENPMAYWNE